MEETDRDLQKTYTDCREETTMKGQLVETIGMLEIRRDCWRQDGTTRD